MQRTWKRIEAWLDKNAPVLLTTLRPGATDEELDQAERQMKVAFPQSVREFYRVHNGQKTDKYGFTAGHFLYGWEWPHLTRVVQAWKSWKDVLENGDFAGICSDPDGGIRNDWWNLGWIPITQNATGDHLCLDMAPDEGGDVGQVISMWHDAPERTLEASSFEEWVTAFADGLEQGLYVYSKGYGGIIAAKEAKYYEK